MKGQISIFDWMPPEQPSFDDVQEPEAVRIIGDALGMTFRWCVGGGYTVGARMEDDHETD